MTVKLSVMIYLIKKLLAFIFLVTTLALTSSCEQKQKSDAIAENTIVTSEAVPVNADVKEPSQAFKDYWYQGKAEITSYKLEQARYGEMRDGEAVLVFVTEDFLPNIQVKADRQNSANIPVLKLNATKNFNTGIYPYSVMQSTFYPVSNEQHALKISSSMQEWCGHVYMQLNNKTQFEIDSHSYFEGEADQKLKLDKTILENELWAQLRIDPKSLPIGDIEVIPSLEFIRMKHTSIKAYKASAKLTQDNYTITYPDLNRSLSINFSEGFPHEILSWEESFKSGFGPNAKTLTTKATKMKTIKSAYWSKNANADEGLRKTLELN